MVAIGKRVFAQRREWDTEFKSKVYIYIHPTGDAASLDGGAHGKIGWPLWESLQLFISTVHNGSSTHNGIATLGTKLFGSQPAG